MVVLLPLFIAAAAWGTAVRAAFSISTSGPLVACDAVTISWTDGVPNVQVAVWYAASGDPKSGATFWAITAAPDATGSHPYVVQIPPGYQYQLVGSDSAGNTYEMPVGVIQSGSDTCSFMASTLASIPASSRSSLAAAVPATQAQATVTVAVPAPPPGQTASPPAPPPTGTDRPTGLVPTDLGPGGSPIVTVTITTGTAAAASASASSSSTASDSAAHSGGGKSKSNTGAIAGGVVGGVAALALLALLALCLRRRRKNAAAGSTPSSPRRYQYDRGAAQGEEAQPWLQHHDAEKGAVGAGAIGLGTGSAAATSSYLAPSSSRTLSSGSPSTPNRNTMVSVQSSPEVLPPMPQMAPPPPVPVPVNSAGPASAATTPLASRFPVPPPRAPSVHSTSTASPLNMGGSTMALPLSVPEGGAGGMEAPGSPESGDDGPGLRPPPRPGVPER